MGDEESAFVVLQAAFKEDYANESTAKELERLATLAHKWEDLLAEYSHRVANLEHEDTAQAADLWVKIARWYGDQLEPPRVRDPLGRRRRAGSTPDTSGRWPRSPTSTGSAAPTAISSPSSASTPRSSPTRQKRVELYLSLADLLETQLQDQLAGDQRLSVGARRRPDRTPARSPPSTASTGGTRCGSSSSACSSARPAPSRTSTSSSRYRLEIGRLWDERLNEPAQAIAAFGKVRDVEPRVAAGAARARAALRAHRPVGGVPRRPRAGARRDRRPIRRRSRSTTGWRRPGRSGSASSTAPPRRSRRSSSSTSGTWRATASSSACTARTRSGTRSSTRYRRHILAAGDPATRDGPLLRDGRGLRGGAARRGPRHRGVHRRPLLRRRRAARARGARPPLREDRGVGARPSTSWRASSTSPTIRRSRSSSTTASARSSSSGSATRRSAEGRFLQALSQDPAHVPTMMSLTALYKKRGDWLKAAQMMIRAEAAHRPPAGEDQAPLRGGADLRQARSTTRRSAMEYYAGTIALDPEHVEAGEPLAELYFREKRWAELEPILDMLARKAAQLKKDNRQQNELYYRIARTADELRQQREGAALLQARLRPRLDLPADAARARQPDVPPRGLGRRRQDLPDHPRPAPRVAEGHRRRRDLLPARPGPPEARRAQEGAQHVREGAGDRPGAQGHARRGHRSADAAGRLRGGGARQAVAVRRARRPRRSSASSTRSATPTATSCRTRRRRSPPTSRRSRSSPQNHVLLQKIARHLHETKQWKKARRGRAQVHRDRDRPADARSLLLRRRRGLRATSSRASTTRSSTSTARSTSTSRRPTASRPTRCRST